MADTPKSAHSHLNLQHLQHHDNPFSRPQTPHNHLQIGFVGLGAMGYPMAKNLAKSRHGQPPLLVWNRTKSKAEELFKEVGADKVQIADDLAEVARDCDIIVTNLANDTVVKSVFLEFEAALKVPSNTFIACLLFRLTINILSKTTQFTRHKIFVETSTVFPSLAGKKCMT